MLYQTNGICNFSLRKVKEPHWSYRYAFSFIADFKIFKVFVLHVAAI